MRNAFIKCELCNVEICDDKGKCAFAIHKRVVDGKEYYFCCEAHADSFEKSKKKTKK